MEKEIWKEVVGYEGIYQVSNLGNVKSLKFKKELFLKFGLCKDGYHAIVCCKDGKMKTKKIHQLVAESFLNHKPCGYNLVVNHKNFNKLDNRLENLEIVTSRENSNQKHLKSSSKYTGVYWHNKNKKWASSIKINGVQKNLGYFISELEASETYQNKLLTIKK